MIPIWQWLRRKKTFSRIPEVEEVAVPDELLDRLERAQREALEKQAEALAAARQLRLVARAIREQQKGDASG